MRFSALLKFFLPFYSLKWGFSVFFCFSSLFLFGFQINNQSPFYQIFGVPAFDSPRVDIDRVSVVFDVAHHSVSKSDGSSILFLKGETYTFNFLCDYGLSENWQVGFELPFVLQRSSKLQGVIDEFHSFLGLGKVGSQKGEDPLYYLNLPGSFSVLDHETEDWGDLLLKLKRKFYCSQNFLFSGLLYWKLPTGNEKKFMGSGSSDYSVALSFAHYLNRFAFDHFWSYSYLGKFGSLGHYQKRNLWSANCGVDYHLSSRWFVRSQLNGISAFYKDTGFPALDTGSLQLFVGLKYLDKSWQWQFFVGEDVWVNHAPDVSFTLVSSYLF